MPSCSPPLPLLPAPPLVVRRLLSLDVLHGTSGLRDHAIIPPAPSGHARPPAIGQERLDLFCHTTGHIRHIGPAKMQHDITAHRGDIDATQVPVTSARGVRQPTVELDH